MKNEQKLDKDIEIIDKWVKSIDAVNHIIDDGSETVRAIFTDRSCADTYR